MPEPEPEQEEIGFVTVEDSDAFFDNRPEGVYWGALDDTAKSMYLYRAYDNLMLYKYKVTPTNQDAYICQAQLHEAFACYVALNDEALIHRLHLQLNKVTSFRFGTQSETYSQTTRAHLYSEMARKLIAPYLVSAPSYVVTQ